MKCNLKCSIPEFKFSLRQDLKDKKEFLPTRSHNSDTGWDVRAAFEDHKDLLLKNNEKVLIPLGIKVVVPKGWWLKVVPRSSTFAKKHLNCLYGVVDEEYENYIYLSAQLQSPNNFPTTLTIPFGERIAQLIPVKRQEMIVTEIDEEEFQKLCKERNGTRGEGGFGSTNG